MRVWERPIDMGTWRNPMARERESEDDGLLPKLPQVHVASVRVPSQMKVPTGGEAVGCPHPKKVLHPTAHSGQRGYPADLNNFSSTVGKTLASLNSIDHFWPSAKVIATFIGTWTSPIFL